MLIINFRPGAGSNQRPSNGEVVQTYNVPSPKWNPTITDTANKYFFVRVWNVGGGDATAAKLTPDKPMTWLAPVWTGR